MAENVPETMTAMGFDAPGGPDVFRSEELPVPVPGAKQVLIKVEYAGVNRPDVIRRLPGHRRYRVWRFPEPWSRWGRARRLKC